MAKHFREFSLKVMLKPGTFEEELFRAPITTFPKIKVKRLCSRCSKVLPKDRRFNHIDCVAQIDFNEDFLYEGSSRCQG